MVFNALDLCVKSVNLLSVATFLIFSSWYTVSLSAGFLEDELEGIRIFDPMSQQTVKGVVPSEITLCAVTEVVLDDATISHFRSRYRVMFGVSGDDDPLYLRFHPVSGFLGSSIGISMFHENMESLFDYLHGALVVLDHQCGEAAEARFDMIWKYYEARQKIPMLNASEETRTDRCHRTICTLMG